LTYCHIIHTCTRYYAWRDTLSFTSTEGSTVLTLILRLNQSTWNDKKYSKWLIFRAKNVKDLDDCENIK